jgi:hypothetical protein
MKEWVHMNALSMSDGTLVANNGVGLVESESSGFLGLEEGG